MDPCRPVRRLVSGLVSGNKADAMWNRRRSPTHSNMPIAFQRRVKRPEQPASWQTSSRPVMRRWATTSARGPSRLWLDASAAPADSSQSAAAAGALAARRSADRATLSSPYHELRGSANEGPA
ncbi:hypothetical protein EYF80_047990 [Liparis tanakae]|uniref:Uncharacterized protein n=1 Tax=Liparis tanakae TaxID=230148 RepID=A0A4Z2FLR5_9TELE|nr:hypothetical protein EYF80_047990 [Liparis tanakae]